MDLQKSSFILLLVLVTVAFGWVVYDFMLPVFWGAAFAVLFHPVYLRCLRLSGGRPSVAAILTLLAICVTVILPLWFVLSAFVAEATNLYDKVESGEFGITETLSWVQSNVPVIPNLLEKAGITIDDIRTALSDVAVAATQLFGSLAVTAGQGAVTFTAMFFLMLYIMYFFLRDGDKLIDALIYSLPIGDKRERALMAKFAEVSRATIKGTLVIGIVQGTLGGIIFAVLGIQAAVFWGTVMALLSLIPVVGAGIVWAPAALVFFINGEFLSAIVLVAFGVLVIGLADNLLRPILVGRDTRMPDYLVLVSTLGGLSVFGASGIVIGPIIASLFLAVWVMFAREFNDTEGAALDEPDQSTSGCGSDSADEASESGDTD